MGRTRVFETAQLVPRPRAEVFAFFSDPDNLERITPPWLRFVVLGASTPEVGEGSELDYRLRIRGWPVRWRSRIVEWRPGDRFTDVQLRGPYAAWRHTHLFEDRAAGTWMADRVSYRLPLGAVGDWIAGRSVAGEVRRIFDYRRVRIAELLG